MKSGSPHHVSKDYIQRQGLPSRRRGSTRCQEVCDFQEDATVCGVSSEQISRDNEWYHGPGVQTLLGGSFRKNRIDTRHAQAPDARGILF